MGIWLILTIYGVGFTIVFFALLVFQAREEALNKGDLDKDVWKIIMTITVVWPIIIPGAIAWLTGKYGYQKLVKYFLDQNNV